MFSEDAVERAADRGYVCRLCRPFVTAPPEPDPPVPKEEPPPPPPPVIKIKEPGEMSFYVTDEVNSLLGQYSVSWDEI